MRRDLDSADVAPRATVLTLESEGIASLVGPFVLTPTGLWVYIATWRQLARGWTAQARERPDSPYAPKLRLRAQFALFAAHEAERLLRRIDTKAVYPAEPTASDIGCRLAFADGRPPTRSNHAATFSSDGSNGWPTPRPKSSAQ